jgi:hypothetical protein
MQAPASHVDKPAAHHMAVGKHSAGDQGCCHPAAGIAHSGTDRSARIHWGILQSSAIQEWQADRELQQLLPGKQTHAECQRIRRCHPLLGVPPSPSPPPPPHVCISCLCWFALIPAGLAAVAAGSMWLLDSWTPAPSYLVLIPAVLTAVLVALDGCWARGVSWGDLGGSAARWVLVTLHLGC